MKRTIVALIVLLFISFLFGCNKKAVTKAESSPASSEVVSSGQSSQTVSQYSPSSNTASSAPRSAALSKKHIEF